MKFDEIIFQCNIKVLDKKIIIRMSKSECRGGRAYWELSRGSSSSFLRLPLSYEGDGRSTSDNIGNSLSRVGLSSVRLQAVFLKSFIPIFSFRCCNSIGWLLSEVGAISSIVL